MSLKKCFTTQDIEKQIDHKASEDADNLNEFFDKFIDTIKQDAPLGIDELRCIDALNKNEFQKLFDLYIKQLEVHFFKSF